MKRAELLLALFFVLAAFSWIVRDTTPMTVWDSYAEASNVLRVVDAGFPKTLGALSERLKTLREGGRPPLYQIATIPFVWIFGRSEDAIVSVNILFFAILLAGTYGFARAVGGRAAGLGAMIAIACFPPVIYLSHQYRMYNGAVAFVAVALFLLVCLFQRRTVGYVWASSLAVVMALLMHPVAARILFLPVVTVWVTVLLAPPNGATGRRDQSLWRRLIGRCTAPVVLKGLIPASVAVLGCLWAWYWLYGQYLMHIFVTMRTGWLQAFRGAAKMHGEVPWVTGDLRWYPLTTAYAISMPLALLVVIGSVWLVAKGRTLERFLVLWLGAAYLALGLQTRLSWTYGAFGLPLVAAVLGASATLRMPTKMRRVTVGGLVLFSLFNFAAVTWHLGFVPRQFARVYGMRPQPCGPLLCEKPAQHLYWPITDVVEALRTAESGPAISKPVKAFTLTPRIPSSCFDFISGRFWGWNELRFVGSRFPGWGRSFPFEDLLRSDWIIVREPLDGTCRGSWNPYRRALACFLMHPPGEFQRGHVLARRFGLQGGGSIALLKRTGPVTVAEVEATVKGLGLAAKYVTESSLVTAAILEREGKTAEALSRLEASEQVGGQPPWTRARILTTLGWLQMKEGNLDKARKALSEALLVAPVMRRPRVLLSRLEQIERHRPAQDN